VDSHVDRSACHGRAGRWRCPVAVAVDGEDGVLLLGEAGTSTRLVLLAESRLVGDEHGVGCIDGTGGDRTVPGEEA
jgi:hypothetical protein